MAYRKITVSNSSFVRNKLLGNLYSIQTINTHDYYKGEVWANCHTVNFIKLKCTWIRSRILDVYEIWYIFSWAGQLNLYSDWLHAARSGIESQWGRPSRPALGPTKPPVKRILCLFRGRGGRGMGLTPTPHLVSKVLEKSRAIPLLTLRACVAYKNGRNLPTWYIFSKIHYIFWLFLQLFNCKHTL